MNFKKELTTRVNYMNSLYPDNTLELPIGLWNYVNNYLFSKKDKPIKKLILRLFDYHMYCNSEIIIGDYGWKIKLGFTSKGDFYKTNTLTYIDIIGTDVCILNNHSIPTMCLLERDDILEISKVLWPLETD